MRSRSVRRSWEPARTAFVAVLLGLTGGSACDEGGEGGVHEGKDAGEAPVHLEARAGSGAGPFARVSYQKKPGEVAELDVQVEQAPPGGTHAVTLDGRELGKLVTDLEGEGELEFGQQAQAFPAGFVAPAAGAVLRIGALMEVRLSPLERLVHLETEIASGKLTGKASFKLELLAGARTREFKLKVTGAPRDTTHSVSLDGVPVGTLEIGSDGKGKLEYSEAERMPFPAGFREPKAGTTLALGQLFTGPLVALAAKGEAR